MDSRVSESRAKVKIAKLARKYKRGKIPKQYMFWNEDMTTMYSSLCGSDTGRVFETMECSSNHAPILLERLPTANEIVIGYTTVIGHQPNSRHNIATGYTLAETFTCVDMTAEAFMKKCGQTLHVDKELRKMMQHSLAQD